MQEGTGMGDRALVEQLLKQTKITCCNLEEDSDTE
jgi:hypothetical protein